MDYYINMKYSDKQIRDMKSLCNYHIKISVNNQFIKAIEELSSLNKLLAKLLLGEIKKHNIELLDELFDADTMMFHLKNILVSDEYMSTLYDNVVNAKLKRELKRWGLD